MRDNRMQNMMDNIKLSEQDKRRIVESCLERQHVQNRGFRYSRQIAAALAIGVLSVSSLTVYAAVNAYQAYMEKMSREEIAERYGEVQSGEKGADSFSRPLSEAERNSLKELTIAYQEGLCFPEESMKRYDGANGAGEAAAEEVVYDYENMMFYLPQRELTEEELLQIVDVWEKANYSLTAINGEQGVATENPLEAEEASRAYRQSLEETEEEWLRQASCKMIETITGKEFSDGAWDIVLYGAENKKYIAALKDGSNSFSIHFTEDSISEDWTVYSYEDWSETALQEATEYTEEELDSRIEGCAGDAVAKLEDCFGVDSQVVSCAYGYRKGLLSGEGQFLDIVLTTEAGDRYLMCYDIQAIQLKTMLTYDAGKYDDIKLLEGADVTGVIEIK